MRVIAGTARGRPLRAPAGDRIRPTSDRVRESMFNALGSLLQWPGRRAADLFAGTGALGIEALSRGADSAVFVDEHPAARRLVAENLRATGFEDRARVLAGDGPTVAAALGHFDVVFCDPPYHFDGWAGLLAALDAELVVMESDRAIELPAGWRLVRSKRYGSTVVQFAAEDRPVPRSPTPSRPAAVAPVDPE
jgi:16S rRNA (guanine966-N2)-methyltransferase